MPIYEYECLGCGNEFSVLVRRTEEEETSVACTRCGGTRLKRLISRVVYHVSESDRLARYDPDAPKSESFFRDTRNIGLDAKKRAERFGVNLGSAFESKLEKLRTNPSSILDEGE